MSTIKVDSITTRTGSGNLTLDTDTLVVDSTNNRVGIGTTSPSRKLELNNGGTGALVTFTDGVATNFTFKTDGSSVGTFGTEAGSTQLAFMVANSEKMRLDGNGNLGIGTASPSYQATIYGSSTSTVEIESGSNTGESRIYFTDPNTTGVGEIGYYHNGNSLRFNNANAERMRFDNTGRLLFSKTSSGSQTGGVEMQPATSSSSAVWITKDTSAASCLYLNRNGNAGDGTMMFFAQNGQVEGSVSVSGTTVSYNGGHLSRWSQLTDGTKDTSILKGTVMTNLDKMAVWSYDATAATYYVDGDELPEGVSVGDEKTPAKDAYTKDNEQLNCMAVSSVEGDLNVAGVFVNWDYDDDGINDMNVAMTGDMVIRIAKGTTVARGDLLMSAGDGTAKPQDDDIVRSKTIAKVTSTQVSHTYDDETYLVPCVLMAC